MLTDGSASGVIIQVPVTPNPDWVKLRLALCVTSPPRKPTGAIVAVPSHVPETFVVWVGPVGAPQAEPTIRSKIIVLSLILSHPSDRLKDRPAEPGKS